MDYSRKSSAARSQSILAVLVSTILVTIGACKPKNAGSDLQGIVGIAEDGSLRAFALLPMRNLPTVDFQATESEGVQKAIDLATKGQFYGIVECKAHANGNAEDWMNIVEMRAALGDLGILPNRHLLVTGDKIDAFDGTLPCRAIGQFLATMPELDQVLGSITTSPSTVTQNQFRLAQTIFLSLRGPTTGNEAAGVSPLLQRYIDISAAHFAVQTPNVADIKKDMLSLDAIFNPCNNAKTDLDLPTEAIKWKNNYSCVQTTRKDGANERVYRPGGAGGSAYVAVRNLTTSELGIVHLKELAAAKALDKDLHLLVNLLSSLADWTRIVKTSSFADVAGFLSTKEGSSFDFYGTYSKVDVNLLKGIGLTGDDDESDFELYPVEPAMAGFSLGTCGGSNSAQARGGAQQATCAANQRATTDKTRSVTPSQALLPKAFVDSSSRNLGELLGKTAVVVDAAQLEAYKQQNRGLTAAELQLAQSAARSLNATGANSRTIETLPPDQAAAIRKWQTGQASLDSPLAGTRGIAAASSRNASVAPQTKRELERQLEVQVAMQQLQTGQRSTKVGNSNYEFLGVRGNGSSEYAAMRETTTGAYTFVDKKTGAQQAWAPMTAQDPGTVKAKAAFATTNPGATTTVFQQSGTNRFQATSLNANKQQVSTLGIGTPAGEVLAYDTIQTKGTSDGKAIDVASVSIDWKNSEKNQGQIVSQLSQAVATRRTEFSTEFKSANPNVTQDEINNMFKMSNSGTLDVATAKSAGISDTTFNSFNTAKQTSFDPKLNSDIGTMLTPSDQAVLGISASNADPNRALAQAITDSGAGSGAGNVTLSDNSTAAQQELFAPYVPPTTPSPTNSSPASASGTTTQGPASVPAGESKLEQATPADTSTKLNANTLIALTDDDAAAKPKCALLKTVEERSACRAKIDNK